MSVDLTAKPFNLDEEQQKWVKDTLASMSLEEKIGQMFCPAMSSFSKKSIEDAVRFSGSKIEDIENGQ